MNSEEEQESRQELPTSATELGSRLAAVADLLGHRKDAAAKADVSYVQLARYIRGASMPPLDVAGRLCQAAGVSLDWLLTGEGEMRRADQTSAAAPARGGAFDEELHALVVDGITVVYKEEGARLPPSSLGRLAARIHGDLAAAYDDPDDRKMALKLALQQLRRDLRQAPTQTQGKHSA